MKNTAMLPSDWGRNPGMAKRTARYACFEHESLEAMIDVCPPQNSEGLFDVDSDAYAVAKLYTSHDELEGVQFRDQREIENQEDMAIVVRDLADTFYNDFSDDLDVESREEPSPGLTIPDDWPEDAEHKTLATSWTTRRTRCTSLQKMLGMVTSVSVLRSFRWMTRRVVCLLTGY